MRLREREAAEEEEQERDRDTRPARPPRSPRSPSARRPERRAGNSRDREGGPLFLPPCRRRRAPHKSDTRKAISKHAHKLEVARTHNVLKQKERAAALEPRRRNGKRRQRAPAPTTNKQKCFLITVLRGDRQMRRGARVRQREDCDGRDCTASRRAAAQQGDRARSPAPPSLDRPRSRSRAPPAGGVVFWVLVLGSSAQKINQDKEAGGWVVKRRAFACEKTAVGLCARDDAKKRG